MLDVDYFDIEENILPYLVKDYVIVYDWIVELLHILKQKYNFIFKTVYNTLIMDLIMICINHFNTKKTKYQTMAIVSIYNVINYIDNINISIEELIWYTDGASNLEEFNKFNSFLKSYISNNVVKIL